MRDIFNMGLGNSPQERPTKGPPERVAKKREREEAIKTLTLASVLDSTDTEIATMLENSTPEEINTVIDELEEAKARKIEVIKADNQKIDTQIEAGLPARKLSERGKVRKKIMTTGSQYQFIDALEKIQEEHMSFDRKILQLHISHDTKKLKDLLEFEPDNLMNYSPEEFEIFINSLKPISLSLIETWLDDKIMKLHDANSKNKANEDLNNKTLEFLSALIRVKKKFIKLDTKTKITKPNRTKKTPETGGASLKLDRIKTPITGMYTGLAEKKDATPAMTDSEIGVVVEEISKAEKTPKNTITESLVSINRREQVEREQARLAEIDQLQEEIDKAEKIDKTQITITALTKINEKIRKTESLIKEKKESQKGYFAKIKSIFSGSQKNDLAELELKLNRLKRDRVALDSSLPAGYEVPELEVGQALPTDLKKRKEIIRKTETKKINKTAERNKNQVESFNHIPKDQLLNMAVRLAEPENEAEDTPRNKALRTAFLINIEGRKNGKEITPKEHKKLVDLIYNSTPEKLQPPTEIKLPETKIGDEVEQTLIRPPVPRVKSASFRLADFTKPPTDGNTDDIEDTTIRSLHPPSRPKPAPDQKDNEKKAV